MMTNKIREYILVKDEFNHAKLEEIGCYNWKGDLKYTDEIYRMLNDIFKMDKLLTENAYTIAFDHAKKIKGVCKIGQGGMDETPVPMQNIFTFLLLAGATSFVLVHNHVSNMPDASRDDKIITKCADDFSSTFGMEFIGHMVINPIGYIIDGGTMNGCNRTIDELGNLTNYFDKFDDKDKYDEPNEDEEPFVPFENKNITPQEKIDELIIQCKKIRKRAERGI